LASTPVISYHLLAEYAQKSTAMTRRALIIAAPGPATNFLSGVQFDLHNYQNFLLSPAGGGWQPEEVRWMLNPSRAALLQHLTQMQAEYTLVVFSGHGAMEKQSGRSFIEINANGERVWVDKLGTPAAKQLLILDSCRNYASGLSGFVTEGVQLFTSSLNIVQARQLFDKHLARCEAGQIVCHACEPGYSAFDTPSGGLLSTTLFQLVQDWVSTPSQYTTLPVNTVFQRAQRVIAAGGKQRPALRLVPTSREQWFPFAVRQPLQVL
jgi:hypothetical protein